MSCDVRIDRLAERDIPQALRLSTGAGWNQVDADWRRLLSLWPDTCFGWRDGESLIATSTLAHDGGQLGWVGMLLVDEQWRGQGIGSAMFRAALDAGRRLNLRCIGLDATDLGKPLYAREGFVDLSGVTRWSCQLTEHSDRHDTHLLQADDWPAMLALDHCACGVDRGRLLRALAGEPAGRARVIRGEGGVIAYGFARRGRLAGYIGPLIAESAASAERLISALLADLSDSGHRRAFIDTLDTTKHDGESRWLEDRGFSVARRLTRMARGNVASIQAAMVFGIAGLELG